MTVTVGVACSSDAEADGADPVIDGGASSSGPMRLSPGPGDSSGTRLDIGPDGRRTYRSNVLRLRNEGDRPIIIEDVEPLSVRSTEFLGASLMRRSDTHLLRDDLALFDRSPSPAIAQLRPLATEVASCPVGDDPEWKSAPECEWALVVDVRLDEGASQGSVSGFAVSYSDGERSYRTETGFTVGLCGSSTRSVGRI